MGLGDKTYPFALKAASGTLRYKNIWAVVFAYTETLKKVSGAVTTAVKGAAVVAQAGQTYEDSELTDPDVPRCLTVTLGGTSGDIATGTVVISGYNVEGKPISETFTTTANTAETLTGSKAFKRVTRAVISAQDGAAVQLSIGVSTRIGINHRLVPGQTTVKVLQATSIEATPVIQGVPTVVIDAEEVENNYVIPATTPDGTTFLSILYTWDKFTVFPQNDEPDYSTSTSTSSSSTSTSSSSTSTSTSSTSTSTTTTSTSTSSTSTSTTTAP